MELVPQHQIAGFGIGTVKLVLTKFHNLSVVPHNDYVRLMLEVGITGALFYVVFLMRELYRNVKLIFDKRNWFINFPMLIGVIYWLIISFVQNIIYHQVNFPLFLALLAIARRWNEMTSDERLIGK
jgi:O-antigen ligase